MNDPPSIDILIPSFRADYDYLKEIIALKPSDSSIKIKFIIVIDNPNVSEEEIKKLKKSNVLVHKNRHNLGASGSRNVALDLSASDYVLFLDDDIVPHKDLLDVYINSIYKKPEAPGFIGLTNFPKEKTFFTKALRHSDILTFFDYASKVKTMSWGVTANLMIKRKVIGPIRFDQKTFPKKGGGEDIDFCLNIVGRSGKMFCTAPDAVVTHPWWNSGKFHLNRFFRWAYGDSVLSRLHPNHKYYNFPNLVEFLVLLAPFFLFFSRNFLFFWAVSIVASEIVLESIRILVMHKNICGPIIISSVVLIRASNDLGRLLGYIKNRMFPFFQRFDYFTTGVSLSYERKLAALKNIVYLLVTFFFIFYKLAH